MRLAVGGLISTFFSSTEDIEVAAEPIIWFIASQIAERCNSVSSVASTSVPLPPIIRSVIILTSFSLSIRILLPSSPSIYEIWINTQGLSYDCDISSQLAIDTLGVVIFTL